jgi:hypothetical protein
MTAYKFTSANGKTHGAFQWSLPIKNPDGTWTPGAWTTTIEGALEPCANGYHYADPEWVAAWIEEELYEIVIDGESLASTDTPVKHVCRRARLVRRVETWDARTQRLFAVRCARDAMTHVDNPDPRSIAAIDTAERYANGQATAEELAAAWDAAWDAARAAAWDAAWAAARAAARAAAWAAAWDAARDAAWAAAWDAARAAARDAARAAARDAARDTALQNYSGWLLEMCGEVNS